MFFTIKNNKNYKNYKMTDGQKKTTLFASIPGAANLFGDSITWEEM
jgi:hypothetical protein